MKLTSHLKALLLGGTVALTASQTASAAGKAPAPKSESLDARIEKIRQQAGQNPADSNFRTGSGPQSDADLMWWRNAWGNGGWHNWHNGWRNGGWGNWHNW
ncbi:MAG TPA: GrrA/OscA1 family cyclophane-containing rSAM-modified RiPP [Chthoniobacterales bacterium]